MSRHLFDGTNPQADLERMQRIYEPRSKRLNREYRRVFQVAGLMAGACIAATAFAVAGYFSKEWLMMAGGAFLAAVTAGAFTSFFNTACERFVSYRRELLIEDERDEAPRL